MAARRSAAPHHFAKALDEIQDAPRHAVVRFRSLPRHDDVGRAEQRGGRARAARPRGRAGHQLHRHRRDVPDSAQARNAGPHGDDPRPLARAPAARPLRDRDEGRRTRPPRVDPERPQRPDAREHRGGLRHEPRAAPDRLHRPLPDPLAAAQRADVRRDRVRSREGKGGPGDPRAGRGDGRADREREDPPLRPVQRDDVGRVRVPARREGAGRARSR